MKYFFKILIIIFLFSCNPVNKSNLLEGDWELISIVPNSPPESSMELTCLVWLGILSENTIVSFNKDSMFLNERPFSRFEIKSDTVFSYKKNEDIDIFSFILKNDTLKLKVLSGQGDILVMKRKD